MTINTFNAAYIGSVDADFRTWVGLMITAIAASGQVQTSDTGQIDPATVLAPVADNTAAGYAIFRFNDAAQATYPLYCKIEFGRGGASTTSPKIPGMWLTVGKGSDGAGNITNVLFARYALAFSATGNSNGSPGLTGPFPCFVSGGTDWLAVIPWANLSVGGSGANNCSPYFVIERTNAGLGFTILYRHTMNSWNPISKLASTSSDSPGRPVIRSFNYATGLSNFGNVPVSIASVMNGVNLGPSTSLANGAVGPIFPWVVFSPGLAPYQLVCVHSYPGGDAPTTSYTITLGGVTRTYYPIVLSDAHNGFGWAMLPAGTNTVSNYIGLSIRAT